jgi:hypothetical protein
VIEVLAFLAKYWKLILPAILIAGLAVDDAGHRIALANLKAAHAQEIAAAEAAVRKALQADQEASNRLVANYAAEIATLQGSLADALVAQAKAPPTPLCDQSPAARTFDRSLQLLYPPSAAQPGGTR